MQLEGFTYTETDVHFTSDVVPVCIHDATVDRTSDGSGPVNEMTLAQLRQLDFGSWKGTRFSDPDACIGFLTDRLDEGALGKAKGLRQRASDASKVFIASSDYGEAAVSLCREAAFRLEVWTIDSAKTILSLPSYVSGVTSNKLHAGRLLKDNGRE